MASGKRTARPAADNLVGDRAWIIVTGPGDTAEVVASAPALIDMG
jgi:hypothetical protein